MTNERFDVATREVATGLSRRDTARSFGAAMLAALAALPVTAAAQDAAQSKNNRCQEAEKQCKNVGRGICDPGDGLCKRQVKKCCKKCFADQFLRCLRQTQAASALT